MVASSLMLIWIPPSPATTSVCLVLLLELMLLRFFPGKWFRDEPAAETEAARPLFIAYPIMPRCSLYWKKKATEDDIG
jgi:hypothetical protein